MIKSTLAVAAMAAASMTISTQVAAADFSPLHCPSLGGLAQTVAEARDSGVEIVDVIDTLNESGLPSAVVEYMVNVTIVTYSVSDLYPEGVKSSVIEDCFNRTR